MSNNKKNFSGRLLKQINSNILHQKICLIASIWGFHILKSQVISKVKKGKGHKRFHLKKDKNNDKEELPEKLSLDIVFDINDEGEHFYTLNVKGDNLENLELENTIKNNF